MSGRPGRTVDVECGFLAANIWIVATSALALCDVEVFYNAASCPDHCLANISAYPAPINSVTQLVLRTNALSQDPACDSNVSACDGEPEVLSAELPAKSPLRLGGAEYSGFFVAPAKGNYTFQACDTPVASCGLGVEMACGLHNGRTHTTL